MATIAETSIDPDSLLPAEWYAQSREFGEFLVRIADQTVDDYLRRCPEGRTCEYIDGIVYLQGSADFRHQIIIQRLVALLAFYLAERQVGLLLTGPTAFQVPSDRYLEPDLFVLPVESRIHNGYSIPPALLVIEVLSEASRTHDLDRKSAIYREASIPEVWFIDNRDKTVIVDRWTSEGYVTDRLESGRVISRSIPGFWFQTEWLWEE